MYIPEILEGEARGRLRKLYMHSKAILHVPLVPYLFRTLAYYPSFLHYALEVSRPNLLTWSLERCADDLRAHALPALPPLHLPAGISSRDLRGAAMVLPVFHYLNPKLLLLTCAWCEALAERPICGHYAEETFFPPGIPSHFPKQIPLVRLESTTPPIRQLLKGIVDAHRTFGPASDYRALAYYPTFLAGAWQQIGPLLPTSWYREHRHRLLTYAQTLAHTLPYPLPLAPQRLQLILSGREISSCLGILRMFQEMLPGLILDVELMTRMLAAKQGR